MEKNCSCCGKSLKLKNFFKDSSRADGYGSRCKKCDVAKNSKRRRELLDFLSSIRKVGCQCGETESCCMDIHHCESDKEMDITTIYQDKIAFGRVINELKKCVVVCSNCHRKIHKGICGVQDEQKKRYSDALGDFVSQYLKLHPRVKI